MGIACCTSGCVYNDENGFCGLEDIFISDAETGEPVCQDAKFEEDDE